MSPPPWITAIALSVALCGSVTAELSVAEAAESEAEPQTPVPAGVRPLNELAWIVGSWTDAEGSGRVDVECRWTTNRRFLSRNFKVLDDAGELLLEGGQVIGWDPEAAQIRSWTFDSEGGFGEGRWTRDGDRWLIKTRFTLVTGERASALNVLKRVDENTATWTSVNREVGGQLQPNQPEVTVVRATGRPEASGDSAASNEEVSE